MLATRRKLLLGLAAGLVLPVVVTCNPSGYGILETWLPPVYVEDIWYDDYYYYDEFYYEDYYYDDWGGDFYFDYWD
jgi:hypothetical protein